MTQVNMLEAKTDLSRLVKMLESRQEDGIYLARNGTAVVQMKLIPLCLLEDASEWWKVNSRFHVSTDQI